MYKCSAFKGAPNSNYKTRKVGVDASLLWLNIYVLLALSSQLSVFSKLCVMNTLAFFVVSHAVVSGTYPWVTRISPS